MNSVKMRSGIDHAVCRYGFELATARLPSVETLNFKACSGDDAKTYALSKLRSIKGATVLIDKFGITVAKFKHFAFRINIRTFANSDGKGLKSISILCRLTNELNALPFHATFSFEMQTIQARSLQALNTA